MCYSKNTRFDFLVVLKLCQDEHLMLLVTKDISFIPFLHILRRMRNKVFIMIRSRIDIQEITEKIKSFTAIAISDTEFNNFEMGFLHKLCKKEQKKILLLLRKNTNLPFVDTFNPGYINIREGFYE